MNIFKDAGLLIIGTRLKRLSDRFLNEVSLIYKNQNIRFEPTWFPIFFLLDKKGSLSLTEIASELEVSHSAISQMITQLLNKKIVEIQQDTSDARVKKIVFSSKGKKLTEQIHPVWEALHKSLSQVFPPDQDSVLFLNLLSQIEEKLATNFLSETTIKFISEQSPEIELISPDSALMKKFQSWLRNENLDFNIHDKLILLALHRNNIIGFSSYKNLNELLFLEFIYVNPFQRRKGIALKMIQYLFINNSMPCFLIEEANLDLIKVLIKSGYSFKVK